MRNSLCKDMVRRCKNVQMHDAVMMDGNHYDYGNCRNCCGCMNCCSGRNNCPLFRHLADAVNIASLPFKRFCFHTSFASLRFALTISNFSPHLLTFFYFPKIFLHFFEKLKFSLFQRIPKLRQDCVANCSMNDKKVFSGLK